jgi:PEGA domain
VHEEQRLELAVAERVPAGEPTSLPAVKPRRRFQYLRPGATWVMVVVLGFAAVGVAALGGLVFKKVGGLAPTSAPRVVTAAGVIYRPLAEDDAVLVSIQASPREARLMLDGEPLPSNPVRLPRGPKPHKLAATADGFAPMVEEFTADEPKTVKLRLWRARR